MAVLLFVDDDPDLLNFNRAYFNKRGYEVLCASNAHDALRIITTATIHCIILDIDLPDEDGFELCIKLREQSTLPVIFLSGLTEEEIRIKSFLAGGDDYLAKPYSMQELELRINSRIRACAIHTNAHPLCFGNLTIDPARRTVIYENKSGDFTTMQFDVLAFLARHPGQVFTYEQIYDHVWKTPILGSKHNLQVIIATVRQKLALLCDGQNYIETISRKGYRFVELAQQSDILQ